MWLNSPRLTTYSPKTSSNASRVLLAVCAITLSCMNELTPRFFITSQLTEEGWKYQFSGSIWNLLFPEKHTGPMKALLFANPCWRAKRQIVSLGLLLIQHWSHKVFLQSIHLFWNSFLSNTDPEGCNCYIVNRCFTQNSTVRILPTKLSTSLLPQRMLYEDIIWIISEHCISQHWWLYLCISQAQLSN